MAAASLRVAYGYPLPPLLFVFPFKLLKLGLAASNRGLNVSRQFHIWIDGKLCQLFRR